MKNVTANLGIFLVFGLLAGMLLHNSALGVLAGLICHLMVNSIFNGAVELKVQERKSR